MFDRTHTTVTRLAVEMASAHGSGVSRADGDAIVAESAAANAYADLELVKVEGGILGGGHDDPHRREWLEVDDEPHTSTLGIELTRLNHFIDIRKGAGAFDDYDGYSYRNGSAHLGEHQTFRAAKVRYYGKLPAELAAATKIDAGFNACFADQYVHAPGQKWYRDCSPAVERYSYRDAKRYKNVAAEARARFPLAAALEDKGKGVPWSTFMPVDNMARYWFESHATDGKAAELGAALHAVQDAAVPHHAAACWGNWHGEWERDLDAHVTAWCARDEFATRAAGLLAAWIDSDPEPPEEIGPRDRTRAPSVAWRVDLLATWLAVQAYHEYKGTYAGFKQGYAWKADVVADLACKAAAVSALVVAKAMRE